MSSSDESDGDDLLDNPAFAPKRKTRAAEAKETKMLGFLDECVEKETEKADRRSRIDTMMRDDEEDDEGGGDGEVGSGGGDRDGTKDAVMTDAADDSNAAGDASKGKVKAGDDGGAVKKEHTAASPPNPPTKPKPKLADTDDQAYWDRVDRAANGEDEAGTAMGGLSKGARRRFIADAAEGLDDLTDDEVDYGDDGHGGGGASSSSDESEEVVGGGGGAKKEGKDFTISRAASKAAASASASATATEERRKRRAMASAAATGKSSNLGTRRVFFATGNDDEDEESGTTRKRKPGRKRKREPKVLPGGIALFQSHAEATLALKAVLKSVEKEAQRVVKARGGGGWRGAAQSAEPPTAEERTLSLVKRLRASMDADILPEALERDAQRRRRDDRGEAEESASSNVPPIPRELALWLWGAACSSSRAALRGGSRKNGDKRKNGSKKGAIVIEGGAVEPLARAAFRMLESALELEGVPVGEDDDAGALMKIADLVPCLSEGFGLWTGLGPTPVPPEEEHQDDDSASEEDRKMPASTSAPSPPRPIDADCQALRRFLRLWTVALDAPDGRYASWDVDDEKIGRRGEEDVEESSPVVVASKCLAALLRAGIDPSFHCGEGVMEPLRELMLSLAESISDRMDDDHEWADIAADAIVDSVSDMGPGRVGTDDADDEDGFLPVALAVRNLPICGPGCGGGGGGGVVVFSGPSARLKAVTARTALRECLGVEDAEMWDDKVHELIEGHLGDEVKSKWKKKSSQKDEETDNVKHDASEKDAHGGDGGEEEEATTEFPLRWRSVLSAETGLLAIDHLGESMFDDGPRFYAAVELVGACLETGVALFLDDDGGGDAEKETEQEEEPGGDVTKKDAGVYRTTEEAQAMSDAFERIREMCGNLKGVVRSVFTNPHLRRVKELLARTETYCRHKSVEASEAAARRKGADGGGSGGMVQKSLAGWISSGVEESQ